MLREIYPNYSPADFISVYNLMMCQSHAVFTVLLMLLQVYSVSMSVLWNI